MFERMMSEIQHRLRALFRRADLERELDDELAFHIEREAAKLVDQGTSPEEARRSARLAFGGVDRIKDASRDARGTRMFDRARQDITHALRQLRHERGYAVMVIVLLALGIGATSALFSVLDPLFLRVPVGVEAPDELVRLYRHAPATERSSGFVTPGFPYPAITNIATALPSGARLATYGVGPRQLGRGEDAPQAVTVLFGPGYFDVLGVRTVIGRLPTPDEERIEAGAEVALISHSEWQSRYSGDTAVIGRVIELSYRPYTIIGVLPPGFTGLDVTAARYWAPLGAHAPPVRAGDEPYHRAWNFGGTHLIVRAEPGTGDAIASVASEVIARGAPEWIPSSTTVTAAPIQAALGPQEQPGELAVTTRLAGVAVILLLIACANVANLNLARAVRRRREIAVRLALGISRWRLVTLLTTETLLLSMFAATAALLVALWGGNILRATLFPDVAWHGSPLDVRVALFALTVGLVTGLLAGLPPALRAGRFGLTSALKAGARDGTRTRSHLRTGLVAVQASLSVILLVAAGAFISSLQNATSIDVGFDVDRLAVISLGFNDRENHDDDFRAVMPAVVERLRGMSQTEVVALSDSRPLVTYTTGSLYDEAGTEFEFPQWPPSFQDVSAEFFDAMGMRLVAGRTFTAAERDPGAPVIVVNRAMAADMWPGENALGKCLRLFRPDAACSRVIGVVETSHRSRLIEPEPIAQFYRSLHQRTNPVPQYALVRAGAGRLDQVMEAARAQIRQDLPAGAFPDVQALGDRFAIELRPWRLGAALFTALGLLALLVAVVGTYSVIGYLVHQRRHEMGVRMALGARAAQIARLVIAESVRMVGIGIAIGVAAAFALAGLIESLLYETSAREPVIMGTVIALLGIAAGVAALVPAWRATRVHPAEALRSE